MRFSCIGRRDIPAASARPIAPRCGGWSRRWRFGLKCASLSRIAETLVEVYLAGRRVLQSGITRGTAERINAVLWFSGLRGYTSLADSIEAGEIIPLLNDYAGVVISAVHEAGGDVLKLIGDGVLAIFRTPDAASCALRAARAVKRNGAELSARRQRKEDQSPGCALACT
jgi:adenylate cyclase